MNEESVPLRTVQIGLDASPEVATYVGMLEGTIAALTINDVKNRALLELLTGDGWEAARVDFNGDALIGFAAQALVRQTGMDMTTAKTIVTKRWNERNHPADYVVPQAISTDEYLGKETPEPVDAPEENNIAKPMADRLKKWREQQQAAAEEIVSEETKTGTTVPEKSGTSVPEKVDSPVQ